MHSCRYVPIIFGEFIRSLKLLLARAVDLDPVVERVDGTYQKTRMVRE
jgi:hypothetical protein